MTISIGTVSLVRQGKHQFYSFTMESDILSRTCFVVNREEDPEEGFQRELDKNRASEIANYIDQGLGTVPSSIILSAQEDANLEYNSRSKSITFRDIKKAFLIIDGQHRVFGFRLAKKAFRVPVIVYHNLSKTDESRLFIDINSKQKGVPPELLLDIKRMAEYENDLESFLREIFDALKEDQDGILYNRLSPAKKSQGKITRTTFNQATKNLVSIFGDKTPDEVAVILRNYLNAFYEVVLTTEKTKDKFFKPQVFRAICGFFLSVAANLKNKYGAIYTEANFRNILMPVSGAVRLSKINETTTAYKPLLEHFESTLNSGFTL
ncbi:DGQHR domain-containing protein [Litorimonas haliclonae]|uniref:DGQHR domain-containing protein n=1 Tax=Litorimonas haliclonae TaxID=2081977 RepID=UPI0039F03D25